MSHPYDVFERAVAGNTWLADLKEVAELVAQGGDNDTVQERLADVAKRVEAQLKLLHKPDPSIRQLPHAAHLVHRFKYLPSLLATMHRTLDVIPDCLLCNKAEAWHGRHIILGEYSDPEVQNVLQRASEPALDWILNDMAMPAHVQLEEDAAAKVLVEEVTCILRELLHQITMDAQQARGKLAAVRR